MSSIADLQARLSVRVAATNEALMGLASIDDGKRTPKKWVINEVLRLRGKAVEATSEERLEYARIDELRAQQIEQLRKEKEQLRKEKETLEREREQRLGTYGPLLQGEGMEKVRHKLRAVHEAISRGDTRPYLATQDLLNALHALLSGLTPEGLGKGVPLADRVCAIAEAIHGVAMSLANEAKAEEAKKQPVGECGDHATEQELGALAGALALLRRYAAVIDGVTFSNNCYIERGKPRQCRMCLKTGASDLDIVHSKTCNYAAMREFIGFPVLQAAE